MDEYTFHRDEDGKLCLIIRSSDKLIIPIEEENEDYKNAVAWAKARKPEMNTELHVFPEHNKIFSDELEFINYLKESGLRIFLFRDRSTGLLSLSPDSPDITHLTKQYGTDPIARLYYAAPQNRGISDDDGLTSAKSYIWINDKLLSALTAKILDNKSQSEIIKLSNIKSYMSFVYVDVSDFSKFRPGQQAYIVNSIISIVNYMYRQTALVSYDSCMCIGDGYIYAFTDALAAVRFAAHLAKHIDVFNAKSITKITYHFRIGIHCGDVLTFWDPGKGNWNYIGDGINGGNRVLSAAGKENDDVVYLSEQVRNRLINDNKGAIDGVLYEQLVNSMRNVGRRKDKHDDLWRVYELNYTEIAYVHPRFQYK